MAIPTYLFGDRRRMRAILIRKTERPLRVIIRLDEVRAPDAAVVIGFSAVKIYAEPISLSACEVRKAFL